MCTNCLIKPVKCTFTASKVMQLKTKNTIKKKPLVNSMLCVILQMATRRKATSTARQEALGSGTYHFPAVDNVYLSVSVCSQHAEPFGVCDGLEQSFPQFVFGGVFREQQSVEAGVGRW